MASDRIDSDSMPLNHELLSMMLGVRRPGITVALAHSAMQVSSMRLTAKSKYAIVRDWRLRHANAMESFSMNSGGSLARRSPCDLVISAQTFRPLCRAPQGITAASRAACSRDRIDGRDLIGVIVVKSLMN